MCGVFGICAARGVDVANITYFGMFALRHRGQEPAGIAASDGHSVRVHRDMGLVARVFPPAIFKGMCAGSFPARGHPPSTTTGPPPPHSSTPPPLTPPP